MTSLCKTECLVVQDFHRAWEPVTTLASVDDDGGDGDDNDSVCASGCVCIQFQCDEYPIPRWLALHETERTNPLNQHEALAARLRLPIKVIVSRKEDRMGNEFNISSADRCNLIVVPVKQI